MRKKWGMKTKRLQKPRKQILSAFLVCMLLTGLFLSAANMEVAAASGLVRRQSGRAARLPDGYHGAHRAGR